MNFRPKNNLYCVVVDGFDPWACEDAEFIDSYYSAGDDCVAVKSGKDSDATIPWPCGTTMPTKNVRIDNVTCDGSHGLTIGSEMSGGIDNVSFTNLRISHSGPSVRIKSQCGRRGYVKNILCLLHSSVPPGVILRTPMLKYNSKRVEQIADNCA